MANAPAILVLSHGPMCEGLVESVKMVYGNVDGLEALSLREGDNPEEYEEKFLALVDKYDGNVFVCVDIFGGTPFNTIMSCARTRKFAAIAGINMPMLVELLATRDTLAGEDLAKAVVEAFQLVDPNLCGMLAAMYEG